MLDRQKIEAILTRRFPGATLAQVAAATNAIMGLDDEWEEVPGKCRRQTAAETVTAEIATPDTSDKDFKPDLPTEGLVHKRP